MFKLLTNNKIKLESQAQPDYDGKSLRTAFTRLGLLRFRGTIEAQLARVNLNMPIFPCTSANTVVNKLSVIRKIFQGTLITIQLNIKGDI